MADQPRTTTNFLFTPEDGPQSPESSESPDGRKWERVGNDGVFVDATDRSDYKKVGADTTLLPFVEDYGIGLPGKTHPFGMINTGRAWQGGGVDNEKAPIRNSGPVEPATRAWEQQEQVGVVQGVDVVLPKTADLSPDNDTMIDQLMHPKRVLKYRMSGDFGTSNGHGEMIGISPDNTWLGLVYSEDESVFIPVADHEKEISLSVNGQAYTVLFTGIVLPVGDGRSVMVFYKQ